ncbi:MAG: 1-(5-phosphoribosyl)-5-[(5-phosphoribosylamino)methylideneamino]imidazole-4-carboxamide isomerase [Bdellovibrionales bacterium]|nr:1-(5-phosphoribosyl)-5-[(5-phosphoribosylamino)methylideneamino]imidazole-4-carboxamide isomerase [Bdellovibrionales bacterium]
MIKVIPAIDIIDGKCVRLSQGDFDRKVEYSEEPLEIAKKYAANGVRWLHLVDLDGARAGEPKNLHVLDAIAQQTTLCVDFSGGIRTSDHVKAVFQAGAHSVAVGSAAVKDPSEVEQWLEAFGSEYFILGADVKGDKLAISGWLEDTSISVSSFVKEWSHKGVGRFMCTSIERDGLLEGPDLQLYRELHTTFPEVEIIASGGVSSVQDLDQLHSIGVTSVIVGKALLEGKIRIEELKAWL